MAVETGDDREYDQDAIEYPRGYGKPSETATGTKVAPEVREVDGRQRKYPNEVYESPGVAVLTSDPGPTESGEGSAKPDKPLDVELEDWWMQTAADEVSRLVSKMAEYGGLSRATDLTEIGRDLVAAGVSKGPLTGAGNIQEGWLQELGIYFYVRGKFARWQAAIIEGRPVSDDTLLDLGVYVRMAQRIRAIGGWPV